MIDAQGFLAPELQVWGPGWVGDWVTAWAGGKGLVPALPDCSNIWRHTFSAQGAPPPPAVSKLIYEAGEEYGCFQVQCRRLPGVLPALHAAAAATVLPWAPLAATVAAPHCCCCCCPVLVSCHTHPRPEAPFAAAGESWSEPGPHSRHEAGTARLFCVAIGGKAEGWVGGWDGGWVGADEGWMGRQVVFALPLTEKWGGWGVQLG